MLPFTAYTQPSHGQHTCPSLHGATPANLEQARLTLPVFIANHRYDDHLGSSAVSSQVTDRTCTHMHTCYSPAACTQAKRGGRTMPTSSPGLQEAECCMVMKFRDLMWIRASRFLCLERTSKQVGRFINIPHSDYSVPAASNARSSTYCMSGTGTSLAATKTVGLR